MHTYNTSHDLVKFLSQVDIVAVSRMASPQETEGEYLEDSEEGALTSCGWGCFQGLCFRWGRSNNGGSYRYLLHQQQEQQQQENRESWLKREVMKVKEMSEVLAGPKWKTFIRRFSVDGMMSNKRRRAQTQFQYDAQSYKLNFDDGIDKEVDCGHVDFSVRYAVPVGLNKGGLAGG